MALLGAGILVLISRLERSDYLSSVEWETLLFFAGLFIMVGALVKTGVIDQLARAATELTGGNALLTVMLILGVSAPVSGIIDNIPYVATMTPIVSELAASMSESGSPGRAVVGARARCRLRRQPDRRRGQRQCRHARNRPPLRPSHLILGIHPQGCGGHRDVHRARRDLSLAALLRVGLGGVRMSIALTIVLIAFCVQGLVKFAVGFLVPYQTRIDRIATYYRREGRIISIYDSVTLVIIVALVILLFLTDMHDLSFITGLVVGMLIIQIFFHRFDKPLATEQAPESAIPAKESDVVCDPSPTWVGLARNPGDDRAVRLGSLRAHRPPSQVARQPVNRRDSSADDLLSAKPTVHQRIRRSAVQKDLLQGFPISRGGANAIGVQSTSASFPDQLDIGPVWLRSRRSGFCRWLGGTRRAAYCSCRTIVAARR